MRRSRFSAAEARRIALAAQGFDRARPDAVVNSGHIRRVIDRLGLLQLDFVNVLVPAHYLVPFSRLGPYATDAFRRAVYDREHFVEHWAHEASIVPMSSWPLLGYRRRGYRQTPHSPLFRLRNHRRYLDDVLDIVRQHGAITSADLPPAPGPARRPGDWHRSVPRWALEYHFGEGTLSVAERLPNFQRVYDLAERLIPDQHRGQHVAEEEGRRALLSQAAAALGVATRRDLADYFRMPMQAAAPRLDELAEEGVIREVAVDGWREPAWLHRDARLPRRVDACALLSPFDPLVWFRPRSERLFEFHYRIEIYVPEAQRRWGYYVLPFLLGDTLVARVDLKAERKEGRLLVRAAHAEPGQDTTRVAGRLAAELRQLAGWLGLDAITVARRGDLAQALRGAVRRD